MEEEKTIYVVYAGDEDGTEVCDIYANENDALMAEKIESLGNAVHGVYPETIIMSPPKKITMFSVTGIVEGDNYISYISYDEDARESKEDFTFEKESYKNISFSIVRFRGFVKYSTDQDPDEFERNLKDRIIRECNAWKKKMHIK